MGKQCWFAEKAARRFSLAIAIVGVLAVADPVTTSSSGTSPEGGCYLMVPEDGSQPKDFAFVHQPELGIFHLFYIRQDAGQADSAGRPDLERTEKSLGHAWSRDLVHWYSMGDVLPVRPGAWDDFHVWAPSIVRRDRTYYLFYTGVQRTSEGHLIQRIGLATANAASAVDSLKTWSRSDSWVFSHADVPWASHDTTRTVGLQFRDPFVLPDPGHPGGFLMYYVAIPSAGEGRYVIGLARSEGDLSRWSDAGYLKLSDPGRSRNARLESPHVVRSPETEGAGAQWWLLFTRASPRPSAAGAVHIAKGRGPWPDDTSSGGWEPPEPLQKYSRRGESLANWYGSEWLSVQGRDLVAAYDDSVRGIVIREVRWRKPSSDGFGLVKCRVAAR